MGRAAFREDRRRWSFTDEPQSELMPYGYFDFTANNYRWGDSAGANVALLAGATSAAVGARLINTAADLSGTWQAVASGVLPINQAGFWCQPTRTNLCTNHNCAPTGTTGVSVSGEAAAVLSLVNDSAALAASAELAGLLAAGVLNGNVYKIDNTAGVANALVTVTGQGANTNPRGISAYVRGSGSGAISATGGGGALTIALTSSWTRYSTVVTPAASTNQFRLRVDPGAIAYFILNQMEEGPDVTTPIPVAGAVATRNQPQLYFALPAGLVVPLSFAFKGRRLSKAQDGVYGGLVRVAGGFNDTAYLTSPSASPTQVQAIVRAGGVSQATMLATAEPLNNLGMGLRLKTDDVGFSVGGGAAQTDTSAVHPTYDRFVIGGTPWGLGGQGPGVITQARLWARDLTNAQLQSVSA